MATPPKAPKSIAQRIKDAQEALDVLLQEGIVKDQLHDIRYRANRTYLKAMIENLKEIK